VGIGNTVFYINVSELAMTKVEIYKQKRSLILDFLPWCISVYGETYGKQLHNESIVAFSQWNNYKNEELKKICF